MCCTCSYRIFGNVDPLFKQVEILQTFLCWHLVGFICLSFSFQQLIDKINDTLEMPWRICSYFDFQVILQHCQTSYRCCCCWNTFQYMLHEDWNALWCSGYMCACLLGGFCFDSKKDKEVMSVKEEVVGGCEVSSVEIPDVVVLQPFIDMH